MNEPRSAMQESMDRIANALESIALFLQVLAEDQMAIDEHGQSANTVMTQTGPMELS